MNYLDSLMVQLARVPTVGFKTAEFVRMDGQRAVVNVGEQTISLPCVGFYPPVPKMIVQLERRDGQLIVSGPAQQLNPIGTMASTGTPKADVVVDGKTYTLGMSDGYTPVIGDTVEINWTSGMIQGKVKGFEPPAPPPSNSGGQAPIGDLMVRASDSSKFYRTFWTGSMPWASTSNVGAWFYPDLRSTLAGIQFSKPAEMYLPAVRLENNVQIGLHPHLSRPGGGPAVVNWTPQVALSGWVSLPAGFAEWLRDNGGGVAVRSTNGWNQWRGLQRDSGVEPDQLSGAIRFFGSR